jgi:hypothetical protein
LRNSRQRKQRPFQRHEEKRKVKFVVCLSILFIFFNASLGWGQNVRFVEKIEFSGAELPLKPKSFCVTDDQLFIIPDYQAGNIKIYAKVYENNKEFLRLGKIMGRKGYGPDEFSKPSFCYYNEDKSTFMVLDFGLRKIFIYDRIGRIDFKRVKEISCWKPGADIQLKDHRLFISGYLTDPDGNPYDFYYVDITKNEADSNHKTYLLPSYYKYGLESIQEYENQYRKKPDIPVIGINGLFDIYGDYAYFVWEGNLRIIKINIISREIDVKPFGMQPPHYVKPFASQKLVDSLRKRDIKMHESERMKMSYVKNIFTSSKYVLVIYEGPLNKDKKSNLWIQFYTLDGNFIRDVPIPGKPGSRMWFDKQRHILYFLSDGSDTSGVHYFIYKHEIFEFGGRR